MRILLLLLSTVAFVTCTRYDLGNRLDNYNKYAPPEGRTNVEVGFHFYGMKITEDGMYAPFVFKQRWRDRRLAGLDDKVTLAGDSYTSIWRPDLMFRSTGLITTAKMRSNGLSVEQITTVNRTGHVFSSATLEGKFDCLDLRSDRENKTCWIMVESYGERMNKLTLSWMKNYIDFDIYFHLVYEHNNEDRSLSDCRGEDCTMHNIDGATSCVQLMFTFTLPNSAPSSAAVSTLTVLLLSAVRMFL